jgi:hypothetical protein
MERRDFETFDRTVEILWRSGKRMSPPGSWKKGCSRIQKAANCRFERCLRHEYALNHFRFS